MIGQPVARRAGGGEAGFTLLEVLVAFVIAALALGVLFEGAVGGLRATRVADRTEEALSRAQSHLATIGHGVALRTTTQEGDDGTLYRWRIVITPLQSAPLASSGGAGAGGGPGAGAGGAAAGSRLALFRVVVTETWPDSTAEGARTRSVVLRTERLGTMAASGP